MKVPVYILSGGRSSRFGGDKARAQIGGRPLIQRVASSLDPAASSVTVVAARADRYLDLGLRTIADEVPNLGPLGGLAAAVEDCTEDWLLVVACDLVLASPGWIKPLLDGRVDDRRPVAFRDDRGWHPLFVLYPRTIKELVGRRLADADDVSLRGLLDQADAVGLDTPADWPEVAEVDTREDLAKARLWLADHDQ